MFFIFMFWVFSPRGKTQLVLASENYCDFTVKKEERETRAPFWSSPNRDVSKPLLFYLCNPSQLPALIFKDTLIHPDMV